MLNLQLMTERDRREAAKINKRRAAEEERKNRIFNPRARLIGIDETVLEQQINERKRRDHEQQLIDKIFEEELQKADQVAVKLEEKEKQERLKLQQEINEFRKKNQRKEDRREFDLNDPDQIRNQLPARIKDDDPRCGPSSAQKFIGEDALCEQRRKVQKEQFRAWLDQQMQEKERANRERKEAKEAYDAAVIARDQRAMELDVMEKKCRKRIQESYTRFNQALAVEKSNECEKVKKQTMDDNLAEIYNTVSSDLMTENPDAAQSNLGPGRKIAYQSKGMTDEQKREVKKSQLAQIEEAKKKRELETREKREFEEYLNGTQRTIHIMDLEIERNKKEMVRRISEENKKLAEQQKMNRDLLKRMVYTNRMSDEFFEQFNKSTR